MSFDGNELGPFYQLLISLFLGLLVGLQREWAHSPLGGIRTFSLISLLGTVCALLSEKYGAWLIAVGFLGTITGMVLGDLKPAPREQNHKHSGLATEFAMMLMFAIGVLVHHGPPLLAAALAGGLAILMQAKLELHGIVARFSAKEIRAVMQFVLISLVILPVVPDRTFGPYAVFNPRETWQMVVLIVAISLSGYIIYKFFGEKAGVFLGGLLGGLISSTATTLSYAKRKEGVSQAAVIIALACTVLYPRLMIALKLAAPGFDAILAPLGIMFVASAAATLWLWRHAGNHHKGMPQQENPTELKTAITFGVIYSAVLLAVAFAKNHFGNTGMAAVAVLSGMTDMDALSLSTARLVANGKLAAPEAWPLIVTGVISNTCFKGGIVFVLGDRALFVKLLAPFLATIAAGVTLLVFWQG